MSTTTLHPRPVASILAVDDSRAVRSAVRRDLRELGMDISEAGDGIEALQRLRTTKIDLVLLDATMPRMNGVETLRAMRAAGDKTPVIMLSSDSSNSVVDKVLALGVSDYVLNPFRSDDPKAKVRAVLRRTAGW